MKELVVDKTRSAGIEPKGNGHQADASGDVGRRARISKDKVVWRFSDRGIAIRIFLTCWLVFTLHFATNTVREIFPALSIGDKLSFDVAEYDGLHTDTFQLAGRGSFINNNPGASMMGAVPYTLLRPLTDRIIERVQRSRAENPQAASPEYESIYPMAREFYRNARERGLDVKLGLGAGVMQAFAMAPVSALGVVVMFWILLGLTHDRRASVLLALLYAFATPILFRTAQLNQNALLASFALFAFALLWRPWSTGQEDKKPYYFAAGLCTGWTVVLDYSGLVAVAALGLYSISKWWSTPAEGRRFSDLLKFGAGMAICAAILMAYQWSSFGNPFLPAQSYMPPAAYTELGYRGFSLPRADLLFETAFNIRYGLFTSAPLLILALAFPLWMRKKNGLLERPELVFVLSFTALFFIFCSANQYGRMQFNSGVRHIVPVVPFMFLLAANSLLALPRLAAAILAFGSAYWSWCLAMYRDVEQGSGVLESLRQVTLEGFRLPWMVTLENMGYVNGASAIPLILLTFVTIWLMWNVGAQRTGQEPA